MNTIVVILPSLIGGGHVDNEDLARNVFLDLKHLR